MKILDAITTWINNQSLKNKVYFIAFISIIEIVTIVFFAKYGMENISTTRAYVEAEGLYVKAQHLAIEALQGYVITQNENKYKEFLSHLKGPLGYDKALYSLEQDPPDIKSAIEGLVEGGSHQKDAVKMARMFLRFQNFDFMKQIVELWSKANVLMHELLKLGEIANNHISKNTSREGIDDVFDEQKILERIDYIDSHISSSGKDFSAILGETSRWATTLFINLMYIVTLFVIVIGVFIVFILSRNVIKKIAVLQDVTKKVSQGNFSTYIDIDTNDEIGKFSNSINTMIHDLQKLYDDLEKSNNDYAKALSEAEKQKNLLEDNKECMLNVLEDLQNKQKELENEIVLRKNSEAIIRESETRFRSLITNIPGAVYRCMNDENWTMKFISDAVMTISGYPALDFINNRIRSYSSIIHPDDVDMVNECAQKGVNLHKSFIIEYRIINKNGSVKWVYEKGQGLYDEDENLIYLDGAIFDITERKQAEEKMLKYQKELEQSNHDLEQFAYVASHDLQEPLRMVASYTQLLERRYKDNLDDKAKQFVTFAVDGATRMQSLINDLLAYSRIGTKQQPLKTVDVNGIIYKAICNLDVVIKERKARVAVDLLPKVLCDEIQLIQVFQNLISNAIKFCDKDIPEIHISVIEEDNHWRFSVSDNGIGIEDKYSQRIFVIFKRLHTRDKYRGTGIGLSICKKIIERHSGRIWFESELNKGTTFYFTIAKKEA